MRLTPPFLLLLPLASGLFIPPHPAPMISATLPTNTALTPHTKRGLSEVLELLSTFLTTEPTDAQNLDPRVRYGTNIAHYAVDKVAAVINRYCFGVEGGTEEVRRCREEMRKMLEESRDGRVEERRGGEESRRGGEESRGARGYGSRAGDSSWGGYDPHPRGESVGGCRFALEPALQDRGEKAFDATGTGQREEPKHQKRSPPTYASPAHSPQHPLLSNTPLEKRGKTILLKKPSSPPTTSQPPVNPWHPRPPPPRQNPDPSFPALSKWTLRSSRHHASLPPHPAPPKKPDHVSAEEVHNWEADYASILEALSSTEKVKALDKTVFWNPEARAFPGSVEEGGDAGEGGKSHADAV